MKLNVLNRILILAALPTPGEANLLTFKTLKSLKNKLHFSEDEINEFALVIKEDEINEFALVIKEDEKTKVNTYEWNVNKDIGTDFDFTDGETNMIVDSLNKINSNNKITMNHIPLCELFNIE